MEVLQLGINKEEDTSRLVGEAEIWGKWVDISVAEVFLEKWGVPEQSSSARKRSSHKFWLWKTVGIKSEEDRGLLESQAVFLKGPMQGCTQMHLLWVQSLAPKAPGIYENELNCPADMRAGRAGQLSPRGSANKGNCSFDEPTPPTQSWQVGAIPYLHFH